MNQKGNKNVYTDSKNVKGAFYDRVEGWKKKAQSNEKVKKLE